MFLLQLNPPIPLETSKGRGMSHFILDYGTEYSVIWQVFIDETGESWWLKNEEIRAQKNITFDRTSISEIKDS